MKWLLLAGVLGAALLAGTLALAFDGDRQSIGSGPDQGPYRGSEPPARYELPGFSLRNYDGREVDATDLRGRVVVLTFLDSQCTDVCPILASQIGETIDRLTPAERKQVTAVAISTEPDEDTPANVRAFLGKQRALGKLLYLRGPEKEMRSLWKRFQILASLESGEDTVHSAPVRIYDRESVWVATLHAGVDLNQANQLHDIRFALDASDENSG
jgi:cytochrome oxidase Cu insertion factor (SCO1/SenC/PrrC family)